MSAHTTLYAVPFALLSRISIIGVKIHTNLFTLWTPFSPTAVLAPLMVHLRSTIDIFNTLGTRIP
jgi:hypothetical protein